METTKEYIARKQKEDTAEHFAGVEYAYALTEKFSKHYADEQKKLANLHHSEWKAYMGSHRSLDDAAREKAKQAALREM